MNPVSLVRALPDSGSVEGPSAKRHKRIPFSAFVDHMRQGDIPSGVEVLKEISRQKLFPWLGKVNQVALLRLTQKSLPVCRTPMEIIKVNDPLNTLLLLPFNEMCQIEDVKEILSFLQKGVEEAGEPLMKAWILYNMNLLLERQESLETLDERISFLQEAMGLEFDHSYLKDQIWIHLGFALFTKSTEEGFTFFSKEASISSIARAVLSTLLCTCLDNRENQTPQFQIRLLRVCLEYMDPAEDFLQYGNISSFLGLYLIHTDVNRAIQVVERGLRILEGKDPECDVIRHYLLRTLCKAYGLRKGENDLSLYDVTLEKISTLSTLSPEERLSYLDQLTKHREAVLLVSLRRYDEEVEIAQGMNILARKKPQFAESYLAARAAHIERAKELQGEVFLWEGKRVASEGKALLLDRVRIRSFGSLPREPESQEEPNENYAWPIRRDGRSIAQRTLYR